MAGNPILARARHSLIIIEHGPLLYEDAVEMTEYVSRSMSDDAKEAIALFYSLGAETSLEDLTRNADRVFHFGEGPGGYDEAYFKGLFEGAEGPDCPEGFLSI